MPVWGLWLDGSFCFATDAASRKARNLAANPQVAFHLESGDEVVVVEGIARLLTDSELLARFVADYASKYDVVVDPANPGNATFVVDPQVAHTWQERDFLATAIRWRFDGA